MDFQQTRKPSFVTLSWRENLEGGPDWSQGHKTQILWTKKTISVEKIVWNWVHFQKWLLPFK